MALRAKLLTGFFKAMSRLSLRQAQAVGVGIGWILALLPEKWSNPKRVTRINLEVAFPELSLDERKRWVKQSLFELGKTAAELGPVWLKQTATVQRWIQPAENEHLFKDALAKGKGVMVLMPHLGCWEAIASYLSPKVEITFLYRPPNIAEMESFMVEVRSKAGAQLVPTDVTGVRALTKTLKQGNVVGILPDQDPGPSGSVYAPFFGRPARTMTLAGRLVRKTDSEVLFLAMKRLPKGQGFKPIWQRASAKIKAEDPLVSATALNQGVEQLVQRFPTQYQWEYKRYRHPPDGVDDIYKPGLK